MEKKRLWIYIAVAYGITALMSIGMFVAYRREYDTTAFVNVQMMYPACGVILGKLITDNKDKKLPVAGYVAVLVTTAVMMLMAVLSVAVHIEPIEAAGQTIDVWNLLAQIPIIIGSIVAYILFWTCGHERRENAGIERKNIKLSVIMIVLFIAILIGRIMLAVLFEDFRLGSDREIQNIQTVIRSPLTWITIVMLPINFVLSFIAFFGEEYGWRYYLQPIMQNKFGKRTGILLLGLVWAVWHIGVDFMYYAKDYGIQAFLSQIIACVAIAIFFGYAYMKTGNIWVPIIMHYLYNNISAIIAGGGTDSLQDQVVEWEIIPSYAASFVVFFLFILAPIYKENKEQES